MNKKGRVAYDIEWDVDIDDVVCCFDDMSSRVAAKRLGIPLSVYESMTPNKRSDYIYRIASNNKRMAASILGLPEEVVIPDNISDGEEMSDYISDVTGFCHGGFKVKYVISRNEYFNMISAVKRVPEKYEIADLNLSSYSLSEKTKNIVNLNFMEEATDDAGNYMLRGHWMKNLCYQFADKCKFDLTMVDSYSAYAYSDEQMAVFTYCEGDITFKPFTDERQYQIEKESTIKFYRDVYGA